MRTSPTHYINPSAIAITPNANNSYNDLAVYVAPNTTIKVYCPKLGIGVIDNGNFQTWQLTGRNRRLADSIEGYANTKPYTIYARLEKQNQKNGYIVFAPKQQYGGEWYDKYSYITKDGLGISFVEGRTEPSAVDDPKYWYVKIGEVTKADNTKQRSVSLDTGILGTDGWNSEWALNPDALPLRIDMVYKIGPRFTPEEEEPERWDAGSPLYVRWDQRLDIHAQLVEGWTGTDITRFHHWEITRNTGSDADAEWNAAHDGQGEEEYNSTDFDLTLVHTRGQGDDFNGRISALFTFTAYEANPEYEEDTTQPQYLPLIAITFSVMAEPVESYELEVSSETVTYNPQTGEYVPAIEYDEHTQTYSIDSGVTVRVRAKDADGNTFYPTDEQISAIDLHVYYHPIDDPLDSRHLPTLLSLVSGRSTLPSAPFLAGKGVNTWLQIGEWQPEPEEEGDNIILTNRTITYIRFGAKGDTPINCYRWYKEGLTPKKPTATNSDEPAPASGDATGEGNVYPTDKWSATIPNRPATGEWLLWMCSSIRHGDNTRDAWSGPVCISGTKGEPGADAEDREYIYKRLNTYPFSGTAPASINTGTIPDPEHQGQRISSNDKTKNDWVPDGWSDTAMPATSSEKYVYISIRIKEPGQQWGPFSSPVLWTNWGVQGADGDGVQYLYKLFNHELSDSERESQKPSGATFNDNTKEWECAGWSDDPLATTEGMPFCYCSVIQRINGSWGSFGKLGLWSKWAKDGASITKQSEEYRYAVTIDTVQPTQDGSPTGQAELSKWYESKDRVLPLWTAGRYFWTKTTITWSDDSKTNLYSSERNPNDGQPGQDIIVDGATVMKYAVSDSNAVQPTQWSDYDNIKSEIVPGKWLWSQATTYYRKASSAAGSHDAGSSINYNVSYIGVNGANGRAVTGITEYYKATNSDTPLPIPDSDAGWSTDPNLADRPAAERWNEANKYLWNYEKVEYTESNGTNTYERTTPQILAIWTKDGVAGKGIDSITNYYKITPSASAPSKPATPGTEGWNTTPQAPGQGQYLWNYEIITWVNGTPATTYTDVQQIGYAGEDGQDMRENLIDHSEPKSTTVISSLTETSRNNDYHHYGTTDKTYDPAKIPANGSKVSGQARVTLQGCSFKSNVSGSNIKDGQYYGHVLLYFQTNASWPRIVEFDVYDNGVYDVVAEDVTVNSNGGEWTGQVMWRVDNFEHNSGTISFERVKLEVGDRCSGWCLSENDKRITKKSETPYYIKNSTGARPAENDPTWSTTKPTLGQGEWLFTKTVILWSDGSTTVLYTDERNPNDGAAGMDIVVDGATVMKYYVGDSNTTHPADDSSDWKNLSQITQEQGKWLWSQATTYYRKADSDAGSHDAGNSINYNVIYISKDGTAGRAVTSITEYYKATDSDEEMPVPTSDTGWSTNPNVSNWGANAKYLWNYEKVTYSSGVTVERTKPQIVAIWTKDGKGIDSITNYYKITPSANAPLKPSEDGGNGWDDDPTAPGAGEYLWNYEKVTYTDGTVFRSEVQLIGHVGKDGTSPIFADIDNEMDSVACDKEGFVVSEQDIETHVSMFRGNTLMTGLSITSIVREDTEETFTADYYGGSTWAECRDMSSLKIKVSYENNRATIIFRFLNDEGESVNNVEHFTINASAGGESKQLTFTVNGVRPGADGTNAVLYSLNPSASEIVKKKNGGTEPNSNITCSVIKTDGNSRTAVTTGFVLKTYVDGVLRTNGPVNPADVNTGIVYELYVPNTSGVLVDKETIPVVTDGTDGKDADEWTIGTDGYWYKNGTKTATKAEGKDGTGIELKGSVDVVLNTEIVGTQTSLEGLTGMSYGDCYMVKSNGWLYFYDGTTPASSATSTKPANPAGWNPVGEIKGEPGDNGITYYYHTAFADSITLDANGNVTAQSGFTTVNDGTDGYAWVGFCSTNSEVDPGRDASTAAEKLAAAQQYKWNYQKGKDAVTYKIDFTDKTFALDPNTGKNVVLIKGAVYKDNVKVTNITEANFAMRFVKSDGTVRELSSGSEFGIQNGQFVTSFGNGDKTLDGYKAFVVDYKSAGTVVTQNSLALTVYGEKGMDAISGYADYLYSRDEQGNYRPAASASLLGKIDLLSYYSDSHNRIAICEMSGSSYTWKEYGKDTYPNGTMFVCKIDNHIYRASANGWVDEGRFKGDNAVVYKIDFTDSTFAYNPNTAKNVVDIRGVVYKIDGGNTSVFTSLGTDSSLELYFLRTNPVTGQPPIQELIPANLVTISNGAFSTKSQDGAPDRDEMAMLAIVKIGTGSNAKEVTRANIPRGKYGTDGAPGSRGKRGRSYYYAQPWQDNHNVSYLVNDSIAPYFYFEDDGEYYVYNPVGDVNAPVSMHDMGTPSTSNPNWEQMQSKFKYLITEAIFGSFAKFGSAIISGDWMISTNGTIDGTAYNNGALYNNSAAYTWFDPQYPNKSVNTTHSVNGEEWTGFNFVPNYAVDLLTGATYQQNAYITNGIFVDRVDKEYHRTWQPNDIWTGGSKPIPREYKFYEVEKGNELFSLEKSSQGRNYTETYYDVGKISLKSNHLFIYASGMEDAYSYSETEALKATLKIILPPPRYFAGQTLVITNKSTGFPAGTLLLEQAYVEDIKSHLDNWGQDHICMTIQELLVDYYHDDPTSYPYYYRDSFPYKDGEPVLLSGAWIVDGVAQAYIGQQGDCASTCGIWKLNDGSRYPKMLHSVDLNEYDWLELTAVAGDYSEWVRLTPDIVANNLDKLDVSWMITRWEKKSTS